jgi:hypothetical protein
MESVGFKEWAIVCAALGRGEQTILLRKGGIGEGRDGFGFRHPEFFLFPTFFHEQIGKVRSGEAEMLERRQGQIEIRYFAKLVDQREITSWRKAAALEPFHILHASVVRERFDYKQAGLHVALVRVFRITPCWFLPEIPAYGGCRSWVKVPEPPTGTRLEPVLAEDEHQGVVERFRRALSWD